MYTQYTLESHLEEISLRLKDFEILNSIWKLNKKNLKRALTGIEANFPHYSLHDKSHSDTIIKNIENYLGEDRIKSLSPTDTWLILMSTYTHDLGMVLFYNLIEEKFRQSDMTEFLEKSAQNTSDKDLAEAAKTLLEFNKKDIKVDGFTHALKIRNSVTLVISEYFRRIHHLRSKDILNGTDKDFLKLTSNFYSDQIPSRFLNILGEIAYGHGIDFYKLIDRLDYKGDGLHSDKMHPRFVAMMLRLGDLLDVDDKRFNPFTEKIFTGKLPYTSDLHKQKHASIKHVLVSPNSIEITIDCSNEEVYRIARQWFDWLQDEVENQNREWLNIAPENLIGLPPSIQKGKIKVLFQGENPPADLLDLRFTISNEKIFGMLEGGGIYKEPGFVFLRELVQNSTDAIKIQMWDDILKGRHNSLLKKHLKINPRDSIGQNELIEKIKFPDDIPDEILENYEIDINIDWDTNSTDLLNVSIRDNGTGISNTNLIRMTKKVGESRDNDAEYNQLVKTLPFWLKPTGAFGIGIQSVFFVTNQFIAITKTEKESAKKITFRNAKDNNYCSVSKYDEYTERGTTIQFQIDKNNFPKLFGTTFSYDIIELFDYFEDEQKDIFIYKLAHYFANNLIRLKFVNINFNGANLIEKFVFKKDISTNSTNFKPLAVKINASNNLKIISYLSSDIRSGGSLSFIIYENISVGSTIYFSSMKSFNDISLHYNGSMPQNFYLVRDIPIESRVNWLYPLEHFLMSWNLESPKSDKILNISRSEIIKTQQNVLQETFNEKILHPMLILISDVLIEMFNKPECAFIKNELIVTIFNLILTKRQINLPTKHLEILIANEILPSRLVTDKLLNSITVKKFLQAQSIVLVSGYKNRRNPNEDKKDELQEMINDTPKEDLQVFSEDIIIWASEYFDSYVKKEYELEKIQPSSNGSVTYYKCSKNVSEIGIDVTEDKKKDIILKLFPMHYNNNREIIYAIKPFASRLAVVNNWFTGFERFPYLSRTSIISPFTINSTIQNDISELLEKDVVTIEHVNNTFSQLIPIKLIDWVIENNANKIKPSKEEVKTEYLNIILEYLNLLRNKN